MSLSRRNRPLKVKIYKTKKIPCQMQESFFLRSWNSEQLWSDPRSQSTFYNSQFCRDSGLPHTVRNIMGTSGNVFERLLAPAGRTSTVFNNSQNLGIFFSRIGIWCWRKCGKIGDWNETKTAKFVDACTTLPKRSWAYEHTGGIYSHSGVVDYLRFPISELHMRKFLDSVEFQSWKVNFKTEVCSKSADPRLTMHWIREVDIAKSIDEHDIAIDCGAKRFLQSTICLMRWLRLHWRDFSTCTFTSAEEYVWKSSVLNNTIDSCEETICFHDQRKFPCKRSLCSSTRTLRFVQKKFRERRCPRFRCKMGSCTVISKWNPFRRDPGRIAQIKLQKSFCDGIVWSRSRSRRWDTELSAIKNCSETSKGSDDEKSKLQSPKRCCGTWISYQKSRRKESLRGEEVGVFSVDGTWKGGSCSFSHDRLVQGDLYGGHRRKGRSSSPAPNSKA